MMSYEQQAQQQQYISQQQQAMSNFTNLTNLTNMNSVNQNFGMVQMQQVPQIQIQQQLLHQQQMLQQQQQNQIVQQQHQVQQVQQQVQQSNKKSKTTPNKHQQQTMTPIISTPLQLSSVNTPLQVYQPNSQLQPPSPIIKKNSNVNNVGTTISSNTSPKTKGGSNSTSTISTPIVTSFSASTVNSPYLEVVEQESISVENVIINNRNSNVHIVVKNTSFVLKIKSLDMSKINFSTSCVKAGLYYVNEPLKEVSFIQNPPITYVGSSCKNGEQFAIDIKISILSSQHQGNLFYIMVNVSPESLKSTSTASSAAAASGSKDSSSNNSTLNSPTANSSSSSSSASSMLPLHPQSNAILSFPIRVVSKVDHIKKDPNGVCEKKQTFIDILTDRLSVLENIHMTQSTLLSNMLKERGIPESEYIFQEYAEPDLISCHAFSGSPPSSPFSISNNGGSGTTLPQIQTTSTSYSKKHKKHSTTTTATAATSNGTNLPNNQVLVVDNKNTAERFLECFNRVIKVYKEDNYGKKSFELSNFITSLEYDEKTILVDLLESFTFDESSQVNKSIGSGGIDQLDGDASGGNSSGTANHNEDCVCETCPYKQQAEQFMLLSPVICFPSPAIKSINNNNNSSNNNANASNASSAHNSNSSPPTITTTTTTTGSNTNSNITIIN